jgi:hypothetical protein
MDSFDVLKKYVAGNPELEKFVQERELECKKKMANLRHRPRYQPRSIVSPGVLKDFDGSRHPGTKMKIQPAGKIPKRRFNIGDIFECEGTSWAILYMYRLRREPGVWYHCLEECKPQLPVESLGGASILEVFENVLGAGATTPRIVFEPFLHESDARQFFGDIFRAGDSMIRTTQQLLALKEK